MNTMKDQAVYINLVVFSVFDDNLLVFLPNGTIPQKLLDKTHSLDKTSEVFFGSLLSQLGKKYYSEQLYTLSTKSHDGDKINIVYLYLIPVNLKTFKNNRDWVFLTKLKETFYGRAIISYALQRLRWKVEYTNVVYSLLPDEFTLSELQKTYEIILGKTLDKRNFRKKILGLGLLTDLRKKRSGEIARPARIYSFKEKKPVMVKIFK